MKRWLRVKFLEMNFDFKLITHTLNTDWTLPQTKTPLSDLTMCWIWQLASDEHWGLTLSIKFLTSLTRSSSFLMRSGFSIINFFQRCLATIHSFSIGLSVQLYAGRNLCWILSLKWLFTRADVWTLKLSMYTYASPLIFFTSSEMKIEKV